MIKRYVVYIASIVLVILGFLPSPGHAAVEDRGIKVGAGKLHPYYQLEPHFATNPSRAADPTGRSDLEILNRLGLALDVPSDTLKLNMDLSGNYDWYLGLMTPATKRNSDWGLDLDLGMHIAHKKKFSVKLNEIFSRSANAYNPAVTSGLSLISNNTGLDLIMKPGGGALQFTLSYNFMLYWYMANGINVDSLQNSRHRISFQTVWRFLPKTALTFAASTMPTVYLGGDGGDISSTHETYQNINTIPVTATVGLAGLLTNKLSMTLNVGYGGTFVLSKSKVDADTMHTVVGHLELKYNMRDNSSLAIGYNRDVGPASLYRFYKKNEGYLKYQHLLFNKHLALGAKGGYAYYIYGESVVTNNFYKDRRKDGVITGELSIGYNCNRIFSISLIDNVEYRHSHYISFNGTSVGYFTNNLFLRMDIRY